MEFKKKEKAPKMLRDQEIVAWINKTHTHKDEKQWGNNKLKLYYPKQYSPEKNITQWTTKLGEGIVKNLLKNRGMKVHRPEKKTIEGIGYQVDWETKEALWEVKTRNYSTPGTAGEKIFGTIWKYSILPKIFNKPLFIVLVGYQEKEAEQRFLLFNQPLPPERQAFIQMMNSINIYFIRATDLLNLETITIPPLSTPP